MKDIKIDVLGSVQGTDNKIIIESGTVDYFVYIIDKDNKDLVKYYNNFQELVEKFDYDVVWHTDKEMMCPICNKTNFQEEYETCKFCGWINDYLLFDNPSHMPKNKLSLDDYKEVYKDFKTKKPDFVWSLSDKSEFNKFIDNKNN